jgi:hypothetical protein
VQLKREARRHKIPEGDRIGIATRADKTGYSGRSSLGKHQERDRGREMSDFIDAKDLKALWGKRGFELFGFLKKGLQPYTQYGQEIIDTDTLERGRKTPIEWYESKLNRLIEFRRKPEDRYIQGFPHDDYSPKPNPPPFLSWTDREKKQQAKKDFEKQPLVLLNPPPHHMSFTFPLDGKEASKVLAKLNSLLFEKDQASEFAERHGLRPLDDRGVDQPSVSTREEEAKRAAETSTGVLNSATPPKKKASASGDNKNAFIQKGDFWSVYYDGNDSNIKDMECIRYIVYLIDRPNCPFYANELMSLVKGKPLFSDNCEDSDEQRIKHAGFSKEEQGKEDFTQPDMPIESLSDKEKEGLEKIMYKSWGKLNTAKKNGIEVGIKEAEQEFNAAKKHMYNEYGLKVYSSSKGLSFKMFSKLTNEAGRTRVGVTNQISNGIKHIRKSIPSLADHLKRYVETGTQCIYHPDPNHPKWRVEWNS